MAYTAVFFFILGVQVTLISASVGNTTSNSSNYEDHTPTMPFNSLFINSTSSTDNTMTTMSTMVNATEPENATEISYTDILTSEGHYSTPRELPDITPPLPGLHSTLVPMKTTTKSKSMTTPLPPSDGSDSVGIIILIVIIVSAVLAALICYIARNKGRRFSVDLTSRPDEVQIPLSTVEPEAVETITLNGKEDSTQEPQETQAKLEGQVEQKAETEKVNTDASANSAAPPADISEDQFKQDVPEQSPGALVAPSEGAKTDDEEPLSIKTSAESPKEGNEANENNSNNTVLPQRDGEAFWKISLDSMV